MSRPLKIFLSHAHADADAVRTLYDRLVADGVDAWLDKEKLIPGQDWKYEIQKAVQEADIVLVFLSNESVNKEGFVQKEINFALDKADEMPEGRIYLIPIRLANCKVPSRLSSYHWVDLFEKGSYEKLMRSLRLRAKNIDIPISIAKSDEKNKNIVSNQPSLKILVSGGREASTTIQELAYLIGYQTIKRGHILMSHGTRGVDTFSAKGALSACKDKFFSETECIKVFRPKEGTIPDFDFGSLQIVGQTYSQRREHVVANSDAVIILGGGHGTRTLANHVLAARKPLIPVGIGHSGETAMEIWQEMRASGFKSGIGVRDLMKIGPSYSTNQEHIALNAIMLAENLAG